MTWGKEESTHNILPHAPHVSAGRKHAWEEEGGGGERGERGKSWGKRTGEGRKSANIMHSLSSHPENKPYAHAHHINPKLMAALAGGGEEEEGVWWGGEEDGGVFSQLGKMHQKTFFSASLLCSLPLHMPSWDACFSKTKEGILIIFGTHVDNICVKMCACAH